MPFLLNTHLQTILTHKTHIKCLHVYNTSCGCINECDCGVTSAGCSNASENHRSGVDQRDDLSEQTV